jgi:hypothetical protein
MDRGNILSTGQIAAMMQPSLKIVQNVKPAIK